MPHCPLPCPPLNCSIVATTTPGTPLRAAQWSACLAAAALLQLASWTAATCFPGRKTAPACCACESHCWQTASSAVELPWHGCCDLLAVYLLQRQPGVAAPCLLLFDACPGLPCQLLMEARLCPLPHSRCRCRRCCPAFLPLVRPTNPPLPLLRPVCSAVAYGPKESGVEGAECPSPESLDAATLALNVTWQFVPTAAFPGEPSPCF